MTPWMDMWVAGINAPVLSSTELYAHRRRGSVSALSRINNFFLGQDMLVTGFEIAGYRMELKAVRKDQKALKSARPLGIQVTELIKKVKATRSLKTKVILP